AARISGKKRQVHVRTKAETALVFFIASLELCVSHAGGLVQALGRAPGFGRRNPKPNFPTEGGRLRVLPGRSPGLGIVLGPAFPLISGGFDGPLSPRTVAGQRRTSTGFPYTWR